MSVFRNTMMVIQMLAILMLFVDLMFVCRQEPSTLKGPLQILLFSTIIMFMGYVIEIEAQSLETALVGASFAYIGKPYVMLASWQFICAFYNHRIPKWLNYLLAVFAASFFFIVYTNPYHYLYYATTAFEKSNLFSPLELTRGPLYGLYVLSSVGFFLACLYEIIRGYRRSGSGRKTKYAIYILLMILFGISGYALYLTGNTGGYDSTMLGVFLGSICLSVLFFRFRIFDVLTMAKEQALNDSSIGLLVIDAGDSVVYSNQAIKTLVKQDLSLEQLMKIRSRHANLNVNGKIYAVVKKDLTDKEEYLGKAIEVSDITESFNYQSRLEHDVKERTDRIETIQRSIITSIAGIVEARSMETGEHTKRTMDLVRGIAEEMHRQDPSNPVLTEEYIDMLSSAATLHDIGKISVPDEILMKPGKLTDEEFEKIKSHTTAGAMVVEKAMSGLESPEYVKLCKEVAHFHHEKWDGTGYPCGLVGEEIPVSARIMAVADVYDAVTNSRCYKDTVDEKEAIEMIREGSGTQFDPAVVRAFLALKEQ